MRFNFKALHHHTEMRDEVYCQLMKQTTNNKSTKVDSCLKGWRLMAILCAYYKSSDLLKPYLFKYLENNATDSKRPFYSKQKKMLFLILFMICILL